ncbi:hypothetical protein [Saccharopolyspora sp. NPDC002376]
MAVFALALLVIVFGMRMIGALWRKCEMSGSSTGVSLTLGVLPVTILLNLFLVPLAALVFAGCQRVEARLFIGKQAGDEVVVRLLERLLPAIFTLGKTVKNRMQPKPHLNV